VPVLKDLRHDLHGELRRFRMPRKLSGCKLHYWLTQRVHDDIMEITGDLASSGYISMLPRFLSEIPPGMATIANRGIRRHRGVCLHIFLFDQT